MYSISSCLMGRITKPNASEIGGTLGATEPDNSRIDPSDLPQSHRSRVTPFCKHNDGIVARVQFEVVRRTEVGSHGS
jgi:hypothetical protein